jgi:hypothetical protein
MPKGPIFHIPPEHNSEDDSDYDIGNNAKPNLDFNDIL